MGDACSRTALFPFVTARFLSSQPEGKLLAGWLGPASSPVHANGQNTPGRHWRFGQRGLTGTSCSGPEFSWHPRTTVRSNVHENARFYVRVSLGTCLHWPCLRRRRDDSEDPCRLRKGWRHVGCHEQSVLREEDVTLLFSPQAQQRALASVSALLLFWGSRNYHPLTEFLTSDWTDHHPSRPSRGQPPPTLSKSPRAGGSCFLRLRRLKKA
jgi:hypothetical protein